MTARTLEGRTALVTGGGTGVGFGCARRLLQHGARVTIVGRRVEVLEGALERLRSSVGETDVQCTRCDVTVEEDVEAAVRFAADASGQLDIAVANAGSGAPSPILTATPEAWRYASDLNILGTALTIKHAGLAMKSSGGSITAISSVSATRVERFMATYTVTKAGLDMLVRCAALELAPFKIRVNCIQPGYVPTEGTAIAFNEEEQRALIEETPLGRPGAAEEIGDGVVYFAGASGEWVTGQVMAIDGGLGIPRGESFERICRQMQGDAAVDACLGPGGG